MEEISATVNLIVNSIRTKENNRRRKNKRRVLELIDQFEKFDIGSRPETAVALRIWCKHFFLIFNYHCLVYKLS